MTAPLTFDLETEVRELFAAKMREFVAFCGEQWTMSTADAQCLTNPVACPEHWAAGYTAAMETGLPDALELWLDECLGFSRS
jgi:hypothetical protein